MAGYFALYNQGAKLIANDANALGPSTTLIVTLHTSSYTPSAAHTSYSDLTNELATGNGYTQNSKQITGASVTTITTNDAKFDANDVQWVASGGDIPTWMVGVIHVSGTIDSVVNPLLGWFYGSWDGVDPANVPATTSGTSLNIVWHANGIVILSYTIGN